MQKQKLFTDRQTDGRTTQNYSSEPHKMLFQKIIKIQMKIHQKKVFENAFQILSKYKSLKQRFSV